MKRAAIYNRCSTEEEAQINALEVQVSESREIVQSKGWELTEQYIESESGTTSQKRSEYQRLLEDMETDRFDIIVIKSIDRLMRSAREWYIFLDRLTQNHKQLYIYIDRKFYTPDDSLLTGIKAILAEDFSRELSKKIKNAHRRRQVKKTGINITAPMFGWDKTGKDKFILNEEEAEAYRLAFALAKEGKGFYSIANILYEKGVRSKKGTRISDVQWRKMIYSERAHGTVILHTTEYDFEEKKRIKVPKEQWIYVENALPPIVDKKYQEEVLKAIAGRTVPCSFKDYTRDMTSVGRYALSGKIYCAVCGSVYYRKIFPSGKGTLSEWKCSKAIKQGRKSCNNINVRENEVWEILEEVCKKNYTSLFCEKEKTEEAFFLVLRRVLEDRNGNGEIAKLRKEADKLEKKKKMLWDKWLEKVIEDCDFQAANRELTEKINRVQCRINSINVKDDEYSNYEDRLQTIKEALHSGVTDEAITKVLMGRINKIAVHPKGMLEIETDAFRALVPYQHRTGKRVLPFQ